MTEQRSEKLFENTFLSYPPKKVQVGIKNTKYGVQDMLSCMGL
jgi:hypothetical protein